MSSPSPLIPSPLCQMLEGLRQEKLEELIEICKNNWKEAPTIPLKLGDLYPRSDDSEEANRFRYFLENHELRFLGGGNTRNFLVTNKVTRESQVLGVNRKLGGKLTNVDVLDNVLTEENRKKLVGDRLIAPRRFQKSSQNNVGFSLSVIDYFPSGSLNKSYERSVFTNPERYKQCSKNIRKMIIGFQGLQEHGILFPDAKVTNWMIGDDGKLIIADIKSLLTLEQIRASKQEVLLLKTERYIPPEILDKLRPDQNINIENVHAFILGANLYDYLTGNEPPPKLTEDAFKKPIFKDIIGKQYQALIVNLTQADPSSRMSLNDAMKELKFINVLVKASTMKEVDLQKIIDHKTQVLEVISEKLKSTFYEYGREGEKSRGHKHEVDTNQFPQIKERYQNLKGDHLKSKILADFKKQIEKISDKEELAELKSELKKKPEYKVLEKSQGRFTRDGHTSSVKAFEKMFKEQEDNIGSVVVKSIR
jgi:hypothetical protein